MSDILGLLLTAPGAVLALIAVFFFLEVIAGAFALSAKGARQANAKPLRLSDDAGPIAIIVPAHNEGAGIKQTLADAKAQMRPHDRLLLVADNCDDDTASIAGACGAEVLVRNDKARRGKGFALQFAIDALRPSPPAAVFFIDADCRLGADALSSVCAASLAANRPAQAIYLMEAPTAASPKQAVAAFGWLLINKVRMAGLAKIFGFTRLTGAGMAAPWGLIENFNLGSDEIVEDLAMTVQFIKNGAPPVFVAQGLVTSEFPVNDKAAAIQRARWEHGSMRVARRQTGRLLVQAVARGDARLAAMGMDLSVPPLTVFAFLIALAVLFGGVLFFAGWSAPLAAALLAAAFFASGVIIAWAGFGRGVLPISMVGAIIPYFLSKRGVYSQEARETTKKWTRTERDGGEGR